MLFVVMHSRYVFLCSTTETDILYVKVIVIWPLEDGRTINDSDWGKSDFGTLIAVMLLGSSSVFGDISVAILCSFA